MLSLARRWRSIGGEALLMRHLCRVIHVTRNLLPDLVPTASFASKNRRQHITSVRPLQVVTTTPQALLAASSITGRGLCGPNEADSWVWRNGLPVMSSQVGRQSAVGEDDCGALVAHNGQATMSGAR